MSRAFFAFCFVVILALPALSAERGEFRFGSDPSIRQTKPEKPVRIKLKRDEAGKYSWEISGDSAEKIIEADRELRKYLLPATRD